MRFKAMVQQPTSIIRMLSAVSHMAKDCLIVFGPEQWKVMINEKFVASGHPQCYATIPIAYVFSHYMVESQTNNEILLQINIKNLLAAFKSVKEFNGGQTVLKLTKKKQMACLSFEMWQDDGQELRIHLIQDVSVKPIQHSKLYLYDEPTISDYHASTHLPPVKSLKTVIERMRIINSSISRENASLMIRTEDGRLLLEIKTDHCALKTIYNTMAVIDNRLENVRTSQQSTYVVAKIDLRYLLKAIQALSSLETKQTLITITKRTCVTIHARLRDHMGMGSDAQTQDTQESEDLTHARITFYLCVYLDDEVLTEEDEDEDEDDDDDDDDMNEEQKTEPETSVDLLREALNEGSEDDQEISNLDLDLT